MNTIQQHMQLSKQQRQSHIDTNTKCQPSVLKRNSSGGKVGDYTAPTMGMINAKNSLLEFHQIEDFGGGCKIHTCHLCQNSSSTPNGFVCINPQHLYFGSAKENHNDLDPNGNLTGGAKGGKAPATEKTKKSSSKNGKKIGAKNARKALENGNHICQQHHTCPVCGKEGKGPNMKRYHFDNCKHKILP